MQIENATFLSDDEYAPNFHPYDIQKNHREYCVIPVIPIIKPDNSPDKKSSPLMLLLYNPLQERKGNTRTRDANLYTRKNPNVPEIFKAISMFSQLSFITTIRKNVMTHSVYWHPGKLEEKVMEKLGYRFVDFELEEEQFQTSNETEPRLVYKPNSASGKALSLILGGQLVKLKVEGDSMNTFLETGLQPDYQQRYAFDYFIRVEDQNQTRS